ncbi:MAG: hypothetical protein IKW18_00435, partial [Clostridia bacterium]|nr:hypothetical protein [Clostridia bacterium]
MPKRRNTFGEFLKHKGTDWDNVLLAIKKLHEIRNHREYALVKPLVYSTPERKREIAAIARRLNAIDDRAKNNINSVYEPFEKGTFGNSIASMYSKIRFFLDHIDLFEPYADYLEAKTTCDEAGLFDFTEKLESSEHIHSAESVFQKEFYRLWLDAVCEKSASVRRFRRNVHDEKITKFIELDDLQLAIAQMRIREKLIEKLPSPHHLMRATDEVSILNKE